MRIDLRYKPERAVGQDASRPSLTHAHLDVETKSIYASDSYVLVKVPVEVSKKDTSGPLTDEALNAARLKSPYILECSEDGLRVPGYATFDRPDAKDVNTESWEALLPGADEEPVVTVGFTLDMLIRAAEALGGRGFKLEFFAGDGKKPINERPIRLRSLEGEGAEALVMPIKLAS